MSTLTSPPSIFTLPSNPLPSDGAPTATFLEQVETEQIIDELLNVTQFYTPDDTADPALSGSSSAHLRRGEHNVFLGSNLNGLSAPYVALDASRPWLIYWTAHSLDIVGIALDDTLKARAVSTLNHFKHPQGGFAGGPSNSQSPHLLPTYASTSAMAIVGNSKPGGGWDALVKHRQATYDFFMRLKRPDGSFVVCEGGEVDVRGTYCLLVVATLLDILTPELLYNVDTFIASCQTYEGGFACSAYPFPTSAASMAEAHGGYTSCSLLAHFLIKSTVPPTGSQSLGVEYPKRINVKSALRWSALMQGEAIEGGGFRGRSNKLVDGCYSWWVGGGFPVLDELARRERAEMKGKKVELEEHGASTFNYVALQEFVLLAAQQEKGGKGGLRDKPGKRPDLYHTCNNLSGYSLAQHNMTHSPASLVAHRAQFDGSKGLSAIRPTTPQGGWKSEEERQAVRREVWASAMAWTEGEPVVVGNKANKTNAVAPVFNLLLFRLQPFINYFYGQS